MLKLLTTLGLAITLAACSQFNTQTKQVQAVCAAATTAINVVADNIDKLSDGQKSTALKAVNAITPICGQGDEPTYDTVKIAAVQAAVDTLNGLLK